MRSLAPVKLKHNSWNVSLKPGASRLAAGWGHGVIDFEIEVTSTEINHLSPPACRIMYVGRPTLTVDAEV